MPPSSMPVASADAASSPQFPRFQTHHASPQHRLHRSRPFSYRDYPGDSRNLPPDIARVRPRLNPLARRYLGGRSQAMVPFFRTCSPHNLQLASISDRLARPFRHPALQLLCNCSSHCAASDRQRPRLYCPFPAAALHHSHAVRRRRSPPPHPRFSHTHPAKTPPAQRHLAAGPPSSHRHRHSNGRHRPCICSCASSLSPTRTCPRVQPPAIPTYSCQLGPSATQLPTNPIAHPTPHISLQRRFPPAATVDAILSTPRRWPTPGSPHPASRRRTASGTTCARTAALPVTTPNSAGLRHQASATQPQPAAPSAALSPRTIGNNLVAFAGFLANQVPRIRMATTSAPTVQHLGGSTKFTPQSQRLLQHSLGLPLCLHANAQDSCKAAWASPRALTANARDSCNTAWASP